jgi:hypothetical protein
VCVVWLYLHFHTGAYPRAPPPPSGFVVLSRQHRTELRSYLSFCRFQFQILLMKIAESPSVISITETKGNPRPLFCLVCLWYLFLSLSLSCLFLVLPFRCRVLSFVASCVVLCCLVLSLSCLVLSVQTKQVQRPMNHRYRDSFCLAYLVSCPVLP